MSFDPDQVAAEEFGVADVPADSPSDRPPLRAVEPGEEAPAKPTTQDHARRLMAEYSYATGGQQLYAFDRGCYRPGERLVQQHVVRLLGAGWSKRKAEEIVSYIRIMAPELWARPPLDVVNVSNGLLTIETQELAEHDPAHLSPVQLAAAFDPDADCPEIEAFLGSTIPDLIGLFFEIVGYLLTADNRYQRAVMFIGGGGCGKSTAANLIRALLGAENVSAVPLHTLEEDRFATADLFGVLANIFSDLDARALRASSIFKSVTGGDALRAERKNRPSFTFTTYARMVFSANEAPPTSDSSDAFFDRWLILPFQRRHRGTDHQDHDLLAKLTTPAELSGLLNHALVALARLHRQGGFTKIASSERAGERFRIDSDTAAGFSEECCDLDPARRIPKPALYGAYKGWCEENRRGALGAARFNRRLIELHHLDDVSSKGKDYWLGITLRGDDS
jgi:putative DNA primase/helicase